MRVPRFQNRYCIDKVCYYSKYTYIYIIWYTISYIGNIIIHMDFLEIIDIWGRFHPMLHFELTSQGRITVNVAATCAFNSIVRICWLRDLQWKSGCQLSKLTFIKHPLSSTFQNHAALTSARFQLPLCEFLLFAGFIGGAFQASSDSNPSGKGMERVHSRGGLRWPSNLIRCIPHEHGGISTHREREGDSTTVWYCKLL